MITIINFWCFNVSFCTKPLDNDTAGQFILGIRFNLEDCINL